MSHCPVLSQQLFLELTLDCNLLAFWRFHGYIYTFETISQGMKTVFCSELDDNGFEWVANKIRGRVGTAPVYLSLDIDVADPAFAPGTGTPEVRHTKATATY